MLLDKALKWVNEYGEMMTDHDKKEANKILNRHLEETEDMISALEGNHEYVAMFEKDKKLINQALELIK